MAITFNDEIVLVGTPGLFKDKFGNSQIGYSTENYILCDVRSVTRTEFYRAGLQGLKPSFVIIINEFEYQGEKILLWNHQPYSVIRTYRLDGGLLELTVAEKEGTIP